MNLAKVEGMQCMYRSRKRNKDRSYSYFFRRRVPIGEKIFENEIRKYGERREFLGHNYERARVKHDRINAEVGAGLRGEMPRREPRLGEAVARYLEERQSLKSRPNVSANLRQFLDFCGDVKLGDVKAVDVQRFLAKARAEGRLAAVTVNGKLADLRAFFKALEVAGDVEENPALQVRGLSVPAKEDILPTTQQVASLLAASKPWMADILRVFLATGGRPSEVLRLDWSMVNFEGGTLCLMRTKNNDLRPVPHEVVMPRQLRALLWDRYLERGLPTQGLVFVNGHGKPYSIGQIFVPFKRLVRRLGMPWLMLKTFRKLAATEVAERSGDMRVAQKQLGHSRLTTTEIYVGRTRLAKQKAADAIEGLMDDVGVARGDTKTPICEPGGGSEDEGRLI